MDKSNFKLVLYILFIILAISIPLIVGILKLACMIKWLML